MEYKYLGHITEPHDVKKLNKDELNVLCAEMRDCIVNTVSENGGHLASNLGSVELTVALHRSFESPKDTIVFDVGHQCYPHKLLTGRFDDFKTLRRENGISGFMKPDESEHDPFITGHSSASVSAVFGNCIANELQKKDGYSIAVIGDGAMTGGMVYEAFNNIRKEDANLIVVLNDNKMSISRNRGALAKHFSTIRSQRKYFKFKSGVERFLNKIPFIGKYLRSFIFHVKLMFKNALYHSNIFESLGFYYMGPVDGHDIEKMCEIFEISKELKRPVLIHTKTVKGKGYKPAEENPGDFHGVSGFDVSSGELNKGSTNFSSIFGNKLCELAEKDDKICAVTAAMTSGTGLTEFSKRFKDRFFDVGIAEEHAVTFCAGLAKAGMKPVFAVYSTFLQRGYDQIIHDAAIEGLPLTLCVDRAGLVGDDGETHQGLFDVSFLSSIPGVTIFAPSNYKELEEMLEIRLKDPKGVAVIRYPRGAEPELIVDKNQLEGFSEIFDGDSCIVTYGTLVAEAVTAAEALKAMGYDISILKLDKVCPMSQAFIDKLCTFKNVFVFEEGVMSGGVAEKIGFELMKNGFGGSFKANAIKGFVKQASVISQRKSHNLDSESMVKIIKEVLEVEQ